LREAIPKIPPTEGREMKENERMFWHYLIAAAVVLGVVGILVELWRYGTITVPCCG
jgi:hypothetical protein